MSEIALQLAGIVRVFRQGRNELAVLRGANLSVRALVTTVDGGRFTTVFALKSDADIDSTGWTGQARDGADASGANCTNAAIDCVYDQGQSQ